MILLFDIGNTNTHLGLSDGGGITRQANIPTAGWFDGSAEKRVQRFVDDLPLTGAAFCSVVPGANLPGRRLVKRHWNLRALELSPATIQGIGIDYPNPKSIGADRLANAVAVRHRFGAPAVVVDFGTAVTFDVVNRKGNYVGGIIAPGLSAMTDYLHEKTALLPKITIREIKAVIGKSTEEAMLIGAVHGYRGLIRGLLNELKQTLKSDPLPVVATGGYAQLLTARIPEITAVEPLLTLQGLQLVWGARERERIA
jgi:type III pantothenate kinase